jgi:hypothetical protein
MVMLRAHYPDREAGSVDLHRDKDKMLHREISIIDVIHKFGINFRGLGECLRIWALYMELTSESREMVNKLTSSFGKLTGMAGKDFPRPLTISFLR